MKKLSENLKRLRKENNLSQEELAEKLGVSRQSVSKWESENAYPEMDKLIQISKIYNVKLDDLLNNNIKEINEEKQFKNKVNEYCKNIINNIIKTTNMFIKMSFKSKVKCLFEQICLIIFFVIFFSIIGAILFNFLNSILELFPEKIYYSFQSVMESIFLIICLIISILLLSHIFKIRYLNYYDNLDSDIVISNKTESEKEIQFKKESKIVIRDPKHSEYNFLNVIVNIVILFLKFILFFISLMFCFSLVFLSTSFILSFLIAKSGLFFIGTIIIILSAIIVNIIILLFLLGFLLNRKYNVKVLLISFVISLVTFGCGIGICTFDFTNFDFLENTKENSFFKKEVIQMEMEPDLFFNEVYDIEYKEENRNNLKIEYYKPKLSEIKFEKDENGMLHFEYSEENDLELIKLYLKHFNNKKIILYDTPKIVVYSSKENLELLIKNNENYINRQEIYDY